MTGVQTCALPICAVSAAGPAQLLGEPAEPFECEESPAGALTLQTIFDTAARNDLWVVPGCFFCGCKSIFSSVFVQNTPKNMGGGGVQKLRTG